MKPDQEMDVDEKGECTRICMHAWQKEEVTRSVEHILSSLFSPAFDYMILSMSNMKTSVWGSIKSNPKVLFIAFFAS